MDHLDAPEIVPDTTAPELGPQTPLQARIGTCCADTAASFRAIAAVSAQIAGILETGNGTSEDLCGLVQAYEQLQAPAGARLACLGAALSSAGSA
ncbi:hypothetical protein MKK65_08140 [Methylobacterium sp. J-001]|uniref:hypothetical protein n=1 Tax=Methylobacterium sp. J-001 TaxID=2836609 RepID=UPI001FBC0ECA|nr:hypothetical protein [Methylobacterium sp. J-001]MCJ2116549.1 hypothetical protein [Methylobacterium sp. J-001]